MNKKYYTAVEELGITGNAKLRNIIQNLKSTLDISPFKIGEDTLDKWFIRIENKINEIYENEFNKPQSEYNLGLQLEKESKLFAIYDFFEIAYSLFGFNRKNQFYREARLMLLEIGEVLRFAPLNTFENNAFQNLEDFIGRETRHFYHNFVNNPTAIPDIKTLISLEFDIETALSSKTDFSTQDIEIIMSQIQFITQQYVNKIQDYLKGEEVLENLPEGPRKRLLKDIIHYPFNGILEKIQDRKILSQLLFGGEYDQIGNFILSSRAYLNKLFQIKSTVEQWTLNTFRDLHLEISLHTLSDLKLYIKYLIDDFVFNNPEYDYIKEDPIRFQIIHSKEYLRAEYKTIFTIWRAFAIKYEDFQLSFRKIARETNLSHVLTEKLRGTGANSNIGKKTLIKYFSKIQEFKDNENDIQKITIYQEAIDSIRNYAADRHLSLTIQRGYDPIFFQQWYKALLIIVELAELGGIYPLTCEPVEPTIFDGNVNTQGGVFQPHHFGINEKHLLQVERIFILNQHWHGRFNSLARTPEGVRLQEQLREGIISLMELDKDNIDENDIRQVFGDLEIFGGKVSDWWIEDANYKYNIARFNRNRNLIKQGNIYEFIKQNFKLSDGSNPVLERFWDLAKKNIQLVSDLHEDFDFSYLFTQKDIEFIKRTFKLENLSS